MEIETTALLMKSLDGLWLRSQAISHNVANANTPGFRPLKVGFEDALKAAARQGADAIRAVEPRLERMAQTGNKTEFRLDLELADAAATSGRYASVVDLLNRRLQMEAMAASGRR